MEHASLIGVAEFLEKQEVELTFRLFISLSIEQQGEVFSLFKDNELQMYLYSNMPKGVFAKAFSYMPSDLRVDFYQQLSSHEHGHLLPFFFFIQEKSIYSF